MITENGCACEPSSSLELDQRQGIWSHITLGSRPGALLPRPWDGTRPLQHELKVLHPQAEQ